MSRLNELEQEIEAADNALIKMLIMRTRLGKELRSVLDVSLPSHPAAVRQANLYASKMASMFDAAGAEPDEVRCSVEQLFYTQGRAQLGALEAQPATQVPAWVEIAKKRSRGGRKC